MSYKSESVGGKIEVLQLNNCKAANVMASCPPGQYRPQYRPEEAEVLKNRFLIYLDSLGSYPKDEWVKVEKHIKEYKFMAWVKE